MKKKIPFSLEYRDKIESGEVEVVTRDDRHANILKWDAKNSKYPIIGTIDNEGSEEPYNWTATGKSTASEKKGSSDLLLLIEEEFTPFESALMEALTTQHEYAGTMEEYVKEWADVLLDFAEKQLEKKFRRESFRQGYEMALGDSQESMLKSIPMWKKQSYDPYSTWLSMRPNDYILFHKGYYVSLSELECLPKEE